MVSTNFALGNGTFGLDPASLGLQDPRLQQQSLQPLADALNTGMKNKDPQLLMKAMTALSRLPVEDLLLVLGMLDPEIMQQLMQAMSQSAFDPQGAPTGGGGGGGPSRSGGPSGSGASCPPSSTGPATRSNAAASGTPNVAGAKNLTAEQKANAKIIIDEGKKAGASTRDIQIALMTAMQESNLRNLNGGDRDSAGLFQQRPSCGWGSFAQVTDPHYSAATFYKHLLSIPNRDQMSLTQAAQKVQVSAFPDAYAKWEGLARGLMVELGDGSGMTA